MDFGAFFGNFHIIKALNFQIKGALARIASTSTKFSPDTQYTNRKKLLGVHQNQTKIVFFDAPYSPDRTWASNTSGNWVMVMLID